MFMLHKSDSGFIVPMKCRRGGVCGRTLANAVERYLTNLLFNLASSFQDNILS